MKQLRDIKSMAQQAADVKKPLAMRASDVLEMVEEIDALRNVETHARTSVSKLLLSAWAHSLITYFDGLATALSELDFIRNKHDAG